MKAQIYYHGDVDGVMSAVMIGKLYIDNGYHKTSFGLTPVNYDEKEWGEQDLKIRSTENKKPADIIYVLDFPYNKTTDIWYDHHSFTEDQLPKQPYKGCYAGGTPSCASVIFNDPTRDKFKDEDLIKKLVQQVNMVDNAEFPTIDDVYNPTTWGPKFRTAFMEQGNSEFMNEIIRTLIYDRTALYKLEDGNLPWSIEWRFHKVKAKIEEGYIEFKKIAKLENQVVVYTEPHYVKSDRYFAFRLFPESLYTCYIKDFTWRNGGAHIGVSVNPFKAVFEHHNIKAICEKFGGGGHSCVGGIFVDTLDKALSIQKEIIELLNQSISLENTIL